MREKYRIYMRVRCLRAIKVWYMRMHAFDSVSPFSKSKIRGPGPGSMRLCHCSVALQRRERGSDAENAPANGAL
jgi:hypothetical protein